MGKDQRTVGKCPEKGDTEFLQCEFSGEYTTLGVIEAIAADGVAVPEGATEIERLNTLLSGGVLNQIGARVSLPKKWASLMKRASGLNEGERVRLNRLILEAAYPLKCPKVRNRKRRITESQNRKRNQVDEWASCFGATFMYIILVGAVLSFVIQVKRCDAEHRALKKSIYEAIEKVFSGPKK